MCVCVFNAKIQSVDTGKTRAEKLEENGGRRQSKIPLTADGVSSGCQRSVGLQGTWLEQRRVGTSYSRAYRVTFGADWGARKSPRVRLPAAKPAPHTVLLRAGKFCIWASQLPFGPRVCRWHFLGSWCLCKRQGTPDPAL